MKDKLRRLHMDFAIRVAELSHCVRQQNACVLTSMDGERVLAFGYNGTWRGGPNHCTGPNEPGKCECLHAEINSLIKCRDPIEFAAFVTTAPCPNCAKALINSGCKEVVCGKAYRLTDGAALLQQAGVVVSFV